MEPSLIFVAGIFAGWIIEWLFYMLIVRRKNKKAAAEAKAAEAKAAEAKAAEAKAAEAKAAEAKAAEAKAAEAKAAEAKAAEAKAAEAKAAEAKAAEAKAAEAKAAEAKAAEAKAAEAKAAEAETADTPAFDDLSKLKGIGPKLAESLMEVGVTSYAQLAKMTSEDVSKKLQASDIKITNRHKLGDLQAQAKLAEAGKWDELEALKKTL